MMALLKQLLTGLDGQTYDFARILGLLGGVAFIIMGFKSCWTATDVHPFDFQGFGIGFGSMAAGIGTLLKLKEASEPKA
jgi:hypothetical protein